MNRRKHPLLPTGSEEKEVLGVGSIPVAILPSCQYMKNIALLLHRSQYNCVVKIRNTSEAEARRAAVSIMANGCILALILPPLCFLY